MQIWKFSLSRYENILNVYLFVQLVFVKKDGRRDRNRRVLTEYW